MIDFIRRHLGAKLLLSYLAVILVGTAVLGITAFFTAPNAYNRHLGMMEAMTEEGGMMGMMGGETGGGSGWRRGQGSGNASLLYDSFQTSLREALTWSALASGLAALIVSLILSRRVVDPVRAMTAASQRIAAGNFDERVGAQGSDELAQLASSFNRMATQLQQVEERRRQLIGDVAHELRTPLTAIKGSMEGLMDGVLPKSTETFQQIFNEAERLTLLVDDLQELSRVESGNYDLDIRPTPLAPLIETIAKRFGTQFAQKDIGLTIDLPPALPPVQGDGDRVIQILSNLTSNALRYTPRGGKISITASHTGDQVQVNVIDTGIGILAEHLPNIFTRFYRVDPSRSRQAGGSGIGLTITRHLVEAHGGRIWVESGGRDQGSTFSFTLPLANE